MLYAIETWVKSHEKHLQVFLGSAVFLLILGISRITPTKIIPDQIIHLNLTEMAYAEPLEALQKPNYKQQRHVQKKVVKPKRPAPVAAPASSHGGVAAPAGWFEPGQCTWLVWTKRLVPAWNDASDWLWQAKRDGWTTTSVPKAGAIGWVPGHVVYIESVHGSTVTITEANYDYNGSIRTIDMPASKYTYIY